MLIGVFYFFILVIVKSLFIENLKEFKILVINVLGIRVELWGEDVGVYLFLFLIIESLIF